MSKPQPRDWRERWQSFAVALGVLVGAGLLTFFVLFALEWVNIKQGAVRLK